MNRKYPDTVKTAEELKNYYEEWVFCFHDTERNRYGKKLIEGYYMDGTVSEERFLEYCEEVDAELYDDYKDMYESEPWYFEIQGYIEDMQRITGKIPRSRHVEFMFLVLKTGPEGNYSSKLPSWATSENNGIFG